MYELGRIVYAKAHQLLFHEEMQLPSISLHYNEIKFILLKLGGRALKAEEEKVCAPSF
jgi:hypothetical protein